MDTILKFLRQLEANDKMPSNSFSTIALKCERASR